VGLRATVAMSGGSGGEMGSRIKKELS